MLIDITKLLIGFERSRWWFSHWPYTLLWRYSLLIVSKYSAARQHLDFIARQHLDLARCWIYYFYLTLNQLCKYIVFLNYRDSENHCKTMFIHSLHFNMIKLKTYYMNFILSLTWSPRIWLEICQIGSYYMQTTFFYLLRFLKK